jgi:hypothetical protein
MDSYLIGLYIARHYLESTNKLPLWDEKVGQEAFQIGAAVVAVFIISTAPGQLFWRALNKNSGRLACKPLAMESEPGSFLIARRS